MENENAIEMLENVALDNLEDAASSEPVVEETPVEEPKRKKKKQNKTIVGTVVNCKVLNVRKTPSIEGDIIGVVYAGDKLKLDIVKSTNDFYRIVSPNGNYGYCMRDYVERD